MEGLGTISSFDICGFLISVICFCLPLSLTVEGLAFFSGAYVMLGGSGGFWFRLLFVTYLYQVAFRR